MPQWLDLWQIAFLLLTCLACYIAGKTKGIGDTIDVLLENKILKESDLDKLLDKRND